MKQDILIYFGDSKNSIDNDCYKSPEKQEYLDFIESNKINFKLNNIIFPKQVHGIKEIILTNKILAGPDYIYNKDNLPKSWQVESDYLITDLKNTGIGILTADCLPIIIVDNNLIAIIHAGWRGAVNGIIESCVNSLIKNFGSKPEQLKAYLGPCAKACCYEVQQDFVSNLPEKYKNNLINRDNKIYFDLPELAQIKLIKLGVKQQNINLENSICTICNPRFCSHRNHKNSRRQISLVAIKK